MGEARRRGTGDERQQAAIKRDKAELLRELGGQDEKGTALLRVGLQPFLDRMGAEQWQKRRASIVEELAGYPRQEKLEKAEAVRVRNDEIAWYLFLCQQAIEDPLCIDVAQSQRALPIFAGIGSRWSHAGSVKGIDRKIAEVLTDQRKEPDGLLFEILVALAYAERGWQVECVEEGPEKSADLIVRKGGRVLHVECKRMARQPAYAEAERKQFLRLWDNASPALVANQQWIWLKGSFHVEVDELPDDFLLGILRAKLPIGGGEVLLHASPQATIQARLIDAQAIRRHMDVFRIKLGSPALSRLVGGDWAPPNSAVSMVQKIMTSPVVGCEMAVLGTYIDEIVFACGFTRSFDSPVSIDRKARDFIKLLSKAVEQLPAGAPSVIHIAAETMEGIEVERRRTEKLRELIPKFVTDKEVFGVRFHRLQGNSRADMLYESDETVETFLLQPGGLEGVPDGVVNPSGTPMRPGSHWELYRDGT